MAVAHTAGPWTVEPIPEVFGGYLLEQSRAEHDWVTDDDEEWERLTDLQRARDLANARLIAAAPALFDAINCLMTSILVDEVVTGHHVVEALDYAREAIVLAAGEPS